MDQLHCIEMSGPSLIAVNVGNSRVQLGQFVEGALKQVASFETDGVATVAERVVEWWQPIAGLPQAAVLVASVNDAVANRLAAMIDDQLSIDSYRVEEDVPVPIGRRLDPETITGVDRLLNAAAAYERIGHACIVIDVGTAITVDFVDGEGVFHGGAIVPGAAMQLRALHEHTEALPELKFTAPGDEAFGRSTAQAMINGVFHGIRGAIQRLVERYSESYGAFPQIVATGGDAKVLLEAEELVDNIVPDLTLMGIATAARRALTGDQVDGPDVRT